MFKRISKFIPPPRFAVPALGLVIAIGAVAQRAQPVLSKQIARLQATSPSKALLKEAPTYNWMEDNSDVTASISKEARLRRVLDSSSAQSQSASVDVSPGETYTWIQRNPLTEAEDIENELESLSSNQARISEDKASIKAALPRTNFPNDDGVFLYGSSPQRGEFGQGYIVFEKRGGKVVGGMYIPGSEFNCFQGTLDRSGEIAMSVKGYAGDINLTQVASRNGILQTNDSELTNYAHSVTLEDYHQLDSVGNNDRRILKECKANFE